MTYLHLSIHFFLSLTSVGNLNKLHVCFPPVRCVQPIAKQYTIAQECCYERWCTRKLENESESKRDLQTLFHRIILMVVLIYLVLNNVILNLSVLHLGTLIVSPCIISICFNWCNFTWKPSIGHTLSWTPLNFFFFISLVTLVLACHIFSLVKCGWFTIYKNYAITRYIRKYLI